MIRLVDDVGRTIDLSEPANRVASLVPSLTETVCTFGRLECLVAVTRHCTEPVSGLEGVARVGGTKNPDVDAIVSLHPDLVIVNAEENRREDFERLTQLGLRVFVTYPRRVDDIPALLTRLGHAVGAEAAAASAAAALEGALRTCAAPVPERLVFCPVWKNPWMTFNGETFADDLLRLVGARNVFGARRERYFEISLDEVVDAQPEIILLPDEPYVFSRKDLAALAPLTNTPALRNQNVHFVDGKALFWFGTRTGAAIPYLRDVVERVTS